MVGHVLPEIPHHGFQRFAVQWRVVQVDLVHLRPTVVGAGMFERELDVGEGCVDFRAGRGPDRSREVGTVRVRAACVDVWVLATWDYVVEKKKRTGGEIYFR